MPGYIHHIQWCVSDLQATLDKMINSFGFRQTFLRVGANTETVIESGSVRFLISQRGCNTQSTPGTGLISECTPDTGLSYELTPGSGLSSEPTPGACISSELTPGTTSNSEYPWLSCKCRAEKIHTVDSVFNICLEVGDVDAVYKRMIQNGSISHNSPTTVRSKDGEIRVAVVSSPCPNVIHSIVNTEGFSGGFLPGFTPVGPGDRLEPDLGVDLSIDHVTYVCNVGGSQNILSWYNQCCGMERFMVNAEDDPEAGIQIKDEAGMRMMVGEWLSEWMCREEGVSWEQRGGDDTRNFKLVLAEPLPDHEHSHVYKFIQEHDGPGLQHIGLLTQDIIKTVSTMKTHGARFRTPPPTYYTLENKKEDIISVGSDPTVFQDLGILIDKEPGCELEKGNSLYILQIFSHPLFIKDTFFLEAIQRHGSRGFGAGNIRALAQSIIELARLKEILEKEDKNQEKEDKNQEKEDKNQEKEEKNQEKEEKNQENVEKYLRTENELCREEEERGKA